VIAGSLEPRLDACAARRCLRPTRGGGGGGSHFFFFSCRPARARLRRAWYGPPSTWTARRRNHEEQAVSRQEAVCTSHVVHRLRVALRGRAEQGPNSVLNAGNLLRRPHARAQTAPGTVLDI